jgi:hypothetical protein
MSFILYTLGGLAELLIGLAIAKIAEYSNFINIEDDEFLIQPEAC